MTTEIKNETTAGTCFASMLDDQELVKSLAALNITIPSEVQALAIPIAQKGKDLIVQAQTGSGKTLAFMLPILGRIRNQKPSRHTTALIVAPTRELALQVKAVVESLKIGITPSCLIGGASARDQERQLNHDARIVVGTPGRLLDFMQQKLLNLRDCRHFVLDEADEMLSMGFLDDIRKILSKLPAQRQGMFFSATITPRVESLTKSFLKDPETVAIAKDTTNEPLIEHLYCTIDGAVASKLNCLCRIFARYGEQSTIIFCNTKSDTELVEVFLNRRGINARKINSDLSQKERDSVLTSLRSGELKYLIATDIASRGIDIKELEVVINYSLPKESESYVHRTGRTGRAGASGKAISMVGPLDYVAFKVLCRDLGVEMIETFFPEGNGQAAA